MNNKKFALIIPNNRQLRPEFIKSYYDNFVSHKRDVNNVKLYFIDDYSPYYIENLNITRSCSLPFEYWHVRSQIDFFKKRFGDCWKKFWSVIPHRTDACRSFGYLVAALDDVDVIITIDDDNYAINKESVEYDYLDSHDVVNSQILATEVNSSSKWFNTISMLKTTPRRKLYARGYPYSKRFEEYKYAYNCFKVVMNIGLWIGNPDVDSITVLNEGSLNGLPKTRITGFRTEIKRLILSNDTFAPLNTANTAYSRKLLPIIYDTFQGARVSELKLDRFGDIWCNLFIKKILDRVNERISIGIPLVEHRREPRDTFIDFQKEFWGILISEKLFEVVERIDLHSHSYADLYKELVENLEKDLLKEINIRALIKYFNKLFSSMRDWLEIIDSLGLS
ncbi:MAG: hypothetical protein QW279_00055 [Candidatus Jordarchaeaceae archaeon]